jgi:hypothetical protein
MGVRTLVREAALLLLALAPLSAAAQSWSVQVDALTEFRLRVSSNDGTQNLKAEEVEGAMIAIGTPYHIGFGFDGYSGAFPTGDDSQATTRLEVAMLNVFVDIPIPWLNFSLGTGWGRGKLDPNQSTSLKDGGATTVQNKISDLNLWQFYAQIGIPLFWGLDVHASYREFRGHPTSREERTTSGTTTFHSRTLSFEGQVSTVGFRYTF